jgi:TfoX/Sxy family transcriptional regulator of competence genes
VKIEPPAAGAIRAFEGLVPPDSLVTVKKVFGQPAAFANGNMFFGVFGEQLFIRLSEPAAKATREKEGFSPFEPMPGRPMRGYLVLPAKSLADTPTARTWVARSLAYAKTLPPKVPGSKRR